MLKSIPSPLATEHYETIAVERAISDLKRGLPVVVTKQDAHHPEGLLVYAMDGLLEETWKMMGEYDFSLALSPTRIKQITKTSFITPCLVQTTDLRYDTLLALCYNHEVSAEEQALLTNVTAATPLHHASLHLMKLAELLPAALTLPVASAEAYEGLQRISEASILRYNEQVAYSLQQVCEAPLDLKNIGQVKIVGFRASVGDKDHYALIVGTPSPSKPPLVRVHSSCYTGDLLGSLRCDCQDQLHTALAQMRDDGAGGIVLYLMQEGRGIGLTNKLRTYALQANHQLDTVDANEMLGFDDDERLFLPAVIMLKQLGFSAVRLLTNNPRKANALQKEGIHVLDCVPHIMEKHALNEAYLSTKAARLGHTLSKLFSSQTKSSS